MCNFMYTYDISMTLYVQEVFMIIQEVVNGRKHV